MNAQVVKMVYLREILSRFHLVVNQIKRVRNGKYPFLVEDEYDVHTLLRSILKIKFDDIRAEDVTPSYAGGSARIDLVLREEGIGIEVKKASENLREKKIGEQLIIDIERYKEYPKINKLICFIYDPERWMENPSSLQDLCRQSAEDLEVEVIVSPPIS
jgi:hypothetical protein